MFMFCMSALQDIEVLKKVKRGHYSNTAAAHGVVVWCAHFLGWFVDLCREFARYGGQHLVVSLSIGERFDPWMFGDGSSQAAHIYAGLEPWMVSGGLASLATRSLHVHCADDPVSCTTFWTVHVLIVLDLDIWWYLDLWGLWAIMMFQDASSTWLSGFLGMGLECWNRSK